MMPSYLTPRLALDELQRVVHDPADFAQPDKVPDLRDPLVRTRSTNSANLSTIYLVDRHDRLPGKVSCGKATLPLFFADQLFLC